MTLQSDISCNEISTTTVKDKSSNRKNKNRIYPISESALLKPEGHLNLDTVIYQ